MKPHRHLVAPLRNTVVWYDFLRDEWYQQDYRPVRIVLLGSAMQVDLPSTPRNETLLLCTRRWLTAVVASSFVNIRFLRRDILLPPKQIWPNFLWLNDPTLQMIVEIRTPLLPVPNCSWSYEARIDVHNGVRSSNFFRSRLIFPIVISKPKSGKPRPRNYSGSFRHSRVIFRFTPRYGNSW